MIRYFNEALVLTSESPEGLINFVYEPTDASNWFIIPRRDPSIDEGVIYINGLDINGGQNASNYIYRPDPQYALRVDFDGDPSVATFLFSTPEVKDFDYNITLDIYDTSTITDSTPVFESVDISIYNRHNITEASEINTFETTNVLTDGDTSFLLLRTNPKFTGNIKLVADSSNRIYLDTFKVSDILSNKRFRKQTVSGNSVFSSDVRRVFSDLPLGELYRVDDENNLDISIPKTDLFDQYDLNYSYGARLFLDELYTEDYAMLAPIWINKDVPSYFAVFRLDGVYNEETYAGEDLAGLAEKYIINGELHKTWSMKENAPLGIYLRNHVEELLQFRAPVFLSLTDPAAVDFDPNTWYGSAVDKGINTGRSEVPYFFNEVAGNFTDMNAFVSEGFERNNLLLPNMINMEFAFSDEDVSLYSMHRYYGLYLTENELYRISYYADTSGGNVRIISLDGRDSSIFFNSNIFDSSGNVESSYTNRIFGLNDVLSFNRITNRDQADGSSYEEVSEWVNKPGANIFAAPVVERSINPFFSFRINNLLEQGEHLRIIDKNSYIIWEVYGSDTDLLEAGESLTYASQTNEPGYPTVNRVAFSTKGEISDQILAIQKAFNVFEDYEGTPFRTGIRKSDFLSIIILDDFVNNSYHFQRITSNITADPCDPSIGFNGIAKSHDIQLYGIQTPDDTDYQRVSCDSSYGPINFEIYGDRESLTVNVVDTSSYYIYSLDASYGDQFEDYMLYLSDDDDWYRLIQEFDINVEGGVNDYDSLFVEDPIESSDSIIILTENKIKFLNENYWNAYEVYPLSVSLMGINPVKDIDYTVYDATLGYESDYWYDRSDDSLTYQYTLDAGELLDITERASYLITSGSGTISTNGTVTSYGPGFPFNSFFGDVSLLATGNTLITYNVLDGSTSFPSLIPGSSEENINDYYEDPSVKDTLKYGLTIPTVSKWTAQGTDARGNPLRLILNGENFESSTNFIPFQGDFEEEISYPVFKYLGSGERAWESYTYFDINDSIEYTLDGSTKSGTLKNFMFDFPSADIFSKIMYSNNRDVEGTFVRSSNVYYNQYKDTVEGIINGLNFSFNVSASARSILNIKDWDRYRFSFMSTPSRNRTSNAPIEVIVNEVTETILIIWYQGNDLLNYTYRNSSTLPAKGLLSNNASNLSLEGFIDGDPNYSHVKPPFWIVLSATSTSIVNTYGTSNSGYPVDICSPYTQLNTDLATGVNSIFNAYGNNYVTLGGVFTFSVQYNTLYQYVDYTYLPSSSAIGSTVVNTSYQYLANINQYTDNTTNLETLNYFIDDNRIDYYIIREDEIFSNESFVTRPLTISLIEPRLYTPVDSSDGIYTYLGWYQPAFNNFFNFDANEDLNLVDIVNKDFTLGNTKFQSYNNIPQYWYNNVVNEVTQTEVDAANAINYIEDYNIFKAQWDAEYYTLINDGVPVLVDGYQSTQELPAFFGSKLIKLPDVLSLTDWDTTSAIFEDGRNWYTFRFNLTRNIINSFKANSLFLDNWGGLTVSDNVIDGYIKQTIIGYYNITRPKIGVNIYTKPFDGQRLYFELDDSFTLSESKNIEGTLNFVNGDYIYSIQADLLPSLSYYISFDLTEK